MVNANTRAKPRAITLFSIGLFLGAALWVASPWALGTAEPWDAKFFIWPLTWLAVAIAGGLVGRPRGLLLPLGYAIAQMAITVQSVLDGQFGVIGWFFIVGYAATALLLAAVIIGTLALFRHLHR